ncbi:hypothetical protein FACS189491_02570 [Spirochaetia bacterium]|nr:hypothetical protein FACS189491_02570 [Spirochaetia bacterium]
MNNPFTVLSPEKLEAEKADQLFVEIHTDISRVQTPDPAMILGARGSGKSMLIRCLLPDVLRIKNKCKLSELDFFAFHIPVKNTQLNITDLQRLDKHHAAFVINEHFLSLNVLMNVLRTLSKLKFDISFDEKQYKKYFENIYSRYLRLSGCKKECFFDNTSTNNFFLSLFNHAEEMYSEFTEYIINISNLTSDSIASYNLPYLSYLRFIVPVFTGLKDLPDFPNKSIYLFIDDADNLSLTQTKILNSWIASRTQPDISLKVSSQYAKYKTYISTTGVLVESPHDYTEIDISAIYTTQTSFYAEKVKKILEKRLILAGIEDSAPFNYFPLYEKQEQEIEERKRTLRENWKKTGKGYRPSDDALRYARPEYIRDLGGQRKSRSKYMYAGLETIIHLSSGVIRYVLDVAALMYDLTIKKNDLNQVKKSIPYNIQDEILRDKADQLLLSQFRSLETIECPSNSEFSIASKLQNLLLSMGETFHDILISDRSERKVFSIALSNIPTKEIREVLDFGIQTGFLHLSTIGTKDGTGRTWLYIMNRSLAPFFLLDPSGFAGYLFVTNDNLERAMLTGKKIRDIDNTLEVEQLTLF